MNFFLLSRGFIVNEFFKCKFLPYMRVVNVSRLGRWLVNCVYLAKLIWYKL